LNRLRFRAIHDEESGIARHNPKPDRQVRDFTAFRPDHRESRDDTAGLKNLGLDAICRSDAIGGNVIPDFVEIVDGLWGKSIS